MRNLLPPFLTALVGAIFLWAISLSFWIHKAHSEELLIQIASASDPSDSGWVRVPPEIKCGGYGFIGVQVWLSRNWLGFVLKDTKCVPQEEADKMVDWSFIEGHSE